MIGTEKDNGIEYLLGKGRSEEFLIIEHKKDSALMAGLSRLHIVNHWIMEGGYHEYYDRTFINISNEDYWYFKRQLQNIGKVLLTRGYAKGIRLNRPILSGDYIFHDGIFMNIEYISKVDDICRVRLFYYDDGIGIYTVEPGQESWTAFIDEMGIEEISNQTLLITEEVFNSALNLVKESIAKILSSIQVLYQSNCVIKKD